MALAHFCEQHGPRSILCTQVLPFPCAQCQPFASLQSSYSTASLETQIHRPQEGRLNIHGQYRQDPVPNETNNSLPTNFSGSSTYIESVPTSPVIEKHPNFIQNDKVHNQPQYPFGTQQTETCESCGFTVPEETQKKLPSGAPGSLSADGQGKNGSPVLRSRGLLHSCGPGSPYAFLDASDTKATPHRQPHGSGGSRNTGSAQSSSFQSTSSNESNCHNHSLTYLSLRSPPNPDKYSMLRKSIVSTLSQEVLPRGRTSGPFAFGDSIDGYTIAYAFRLPDPKARGRRRAYAFVAQAGTDGNRAFRACPVIWRSFNNMANTLIAAAERYQEEQRQREIDEEEQKHRINASHQITPVSAFLTRRALDPDGRRVRGITARSLAEIVGNDMIFADMHKKFSLILQHLGAQFGGFPVTEQTGHLALTNQNSRLRQVESSSHDNLNDSMAKMRIGGSTALPNQGDRLYTPPPLDQRDQQVMA